MASSFTKKQSYEKRIESLKAERSSFIPWWQELSDFHLAHRGRFLVSDNNKGVKRNTKQINNTSRLATRTLAAGMMAGITSPARPWFKLALNGKPELMEIPEVKEWLTFVERMLREIFNQSNTYNMLQVLYQELGVFAVGSMGVFEDFENVIRCKTYTVGGYMLALDDRDMVDTWAREYQRTVAQLVKEFGYDACSQSVQNNWDNGNTELWVDVCHVIEPNDDRDNMSPMAKDKKFRSVYFEKSTKKKCDKFLRESGFDDFPTLNPRWEVTGEDVYGVACPGMDSLGDTKALQLSETQKYDGIEKRNNPHMTAPSGMRNVVESGLLPGEISFVDMVGKEGLRPAYQFDPKIQDHIADIDTVENRIGKAFYTDLFMMLSNSDRRQITAREIAERHEEKLLMLGPVLERLHNELLDPLIDRTFNIALKAGVLGKIPEALSGQNIKIEYVSVLAQAQRMVATSVIEQSVNFAGGLINVWPELRHKIDPVKTLEEYADASGAPPGLLRTKNEYEDRVAAEQQAIQQQQMAESGPALASSAKVLSETDTEGKNALTDIMNNLQGAS